MHDFDDATRERILRFRERDHELIGETGRSLLLEHGAKTDKAIVLFHGLTASPAQFAQLAGTLHGRGHNVFIPRLPRHGYSDRLTDVLRRLTAAELLDITAESVEIARGLGQHVVVAGFSLGGLLAAWCAQFTSIERAVLIAPYLGIAWVPSAALGYAAQIVRRLPNRFVWWDPIARERQTPVHGYPRYSTHSVAEPYEILSQIYAGVRKHPPRASRIAVVINASETTVNNRAAYRLAKRWQAHAPGAVEVRVLRQLPRSHDIVEPLRNPAIVAQVYPELLAVIDP